MYLPQASFLARLERTFTHHKPDGNQAERYAQIREHAHRFAKLIVELTPGSREQALAITGLEECVMHANAAIARNEIWEGGSLKTQITAGAEVSDRYQQIMDEVGRSFSEMHRDFGTMQTELTTVRQELAALKAATTAP